LPETKHLFEGHHVGRIGPHDFQDRLMVLEAHLDRIRDRQLRLFLERGRAPIPELQLEVRGVDHRRRIARTGELADALRSLQAVGEAFVRVVTAAAADFARGTEAAVLEQLLAERHLFGGLRVIRGYRQRWQSERCGRPGSPASQ
jgi:hypothetical protein